MADFSLDQIADLPRGLCLGGSVVPPSPPGPRQPAGTPTPDGRVTDGTWSRVRFDIILAPAGV